ncbi:hypothetical protein [Lederbergia lenta]|uniref:hypothetical protein n=1 Tax=Lederbergia lenta TaxID=1467 RepID=UPI000A4DA1B7|nr:hypothetical protein [Lederbergia lenta]MCM3110762.1 hypothetical protein [Lederbergia lenta]MEC2325842.1 hypothetical protein [Lederbergia lenta]
MKLTQISKQTILISISFLVMQIGIIQIKENSRHIYMSCGRFQMLENFKKGEYQLKKII